MAVSTANSTGRYSGGSLCCVSKIACCGAAKRQEGRQYIFL